MNTSTLQALITAAALFAAPATALSEDAIHAPAQKTIGVAKPRIVTSLIVMNARGATLDGGKLTLTGVSPNSIMFADRPVRAAGHALTALLVQEWSGEASFAETALRLGGKSDDEVRRMGAMDKADDQVES